MTITEQLITLQAYQPAGLFRGIQTLRQLLPATIELSAVRPGPWGLATRVINDFPRFEWRGAMLDVARHFFRVDDVVKEIAALTTGHYFHVGGDESKTLRTFEYVNFIERVQKIVQSHGKQMIGW